MLFASTSSPVCEGEGVSERLLTRLDWTEARLIGGCLLKAKLLGFRSQQLTLSTCLNLRPVAISRGLRDYGIRPCTSFSQTRLKMCKISYLKQIKCLTPPLFRALHCHVQHEIGNEINYLDLPSLLYSKLLPLCETMYIALSKMLYWDSLLS